MKANEQQVGGEHYKKQKIQHWDYVLANGIPYMEAQIIKYVSRWRDKGGLQDLRKARHFLDKLLEYEETHTEKTIILCHRCGYAKESIRHLTNLNDPDYHEFVDPRQAP